MHFMSFREVRSPHCEQVDLPSPTGAFGRSGLQHYGGLSTGVDPPFGSERETKRKPLLLRGP